MPQNEESKDYTEEYKVLTEQQGVYIPIWQDIRDFILPFTGIFGDEKPTEREQDYYVIFDGTATRASRVLGAGMQGGLTSPARPWFRLSLQDEEFEKFRPVKMWLEDVEKRMYSRFAKSNFYNSIHRVYQEEGGYGQSAMIMDKDPIDVIRFNVLTCGEYAIAENELGVIDTLYRIVWMQARQMKMRFPDGTFPATFNDEAEKNPYGWHRVLHVIKPRKMFDPTKVDKENMPWESIYIYYGGDFDVIHKSGYKDKAIACPRWLTTGNDPYGRSPGWDCLGDVKMLQQMAADLYEGLEKMVRPPLKAAGSLKHEISHMAGMVSYNEDVSKTDALKPIFEVRLDLSGLSAAIQDIRMQIREGFYNDMFLMLTEPKPNMTATEVAERHEEKLLMLGPVIERQFYELLDPVIDRTFSVMYEAGLIPPPPKALIEKVQKGDTAGDLKVNYISLLAQAQKLVTTQSIRAVSDYATAMSQFVPDILDGFDADKALTEYTMATGAPPEIIRTPDMIEQIRKEKIKQMKAAQAAAQAQQAAQTAQTMSQTDMEGDNALTQLQQTMEPV